MIDDKLMKLPEIDFISPSVMFIPRKVRQSV